MKKSKWKKVSAERNFVKLSKGDEIEGIYAGESSGQYGAIHAIETDKGLVHLPTHARLTSLFNNVKVGDVIKLECTGERKGKTGRLYTDYNLYVSEDANPF